MPKQRQRLNSADISGRKPFNRKTALDYIEGHTGYHPQSHIDAFTINMKMWYFHFDTLDESDMAFNLALSDGNMDDILDLKAIEAFQDKHFVKVQFSGRSNGWMCLLDHTGRHGYMEPDDVEDSPLFVTRWERGQIKKTSAYALWPTKELIALSHVLWDFNQLAELLAENFIYLAHEAHEANKEAV